MDFREASELIRDEDFEKLDLLLSSEGIAPSELERLTKLTNSDKAQSVLSKYVENKKSKAEKVRTQKENMEHDKDTSPGQLELLGSVATGDPRRDKSIKMFFDAFKANISNCDGKSAALLARQITLEIFERKPSETSKLIRSKCLNLKDKDNPNLCRRVYNGDISPRAYVDMTSDEMKSESLKNEEIKMMRDSFYECQIPEQKAETDIFRCGKCGQRKCSYRQLQTRSGDEPMTTFVSCECGHRWRFC